MRFERFGYSEFRDTHRKRLAFLRKQQQERERYPLFADQIAAEQVNVGREMAERHALWKKNHAAARAHRVSWWRRARAKLAAYPGDERKELLAYWNRFGCPGTPEYLLCVLRSHDAGTLVLHPPVLRETEQSRQAVAETIRRIHARIAQERAAGTGQSPARYG